jgi:hypothetical protein
MTINEIEQKLDEYANHTVIKIVRESDWGVLSETGFCTKAVYELLGYLRSEHPSNEIWAELFRIIRLLAS